ncbi:MAG: hypothetical protein M3Y37_10115, partial [Chloroflexota bacterium]|nr:hypothetical protein [Chloroflexota bacterium]
MALVLVLASAGPTGASPEQVALQASAACPAPMPVAEVQAGMRGTGLTVSQGTTPDRFSVKILGVLKDGIAPGVDMIIVETDSRAIRRADGIWAGMSGSPVYARDGRLIGAVAYGFTLGPSKLAGLTAAEDMFEVLDYSSEQAAAASMPTLPERVFLTPDLKAAVAAQTNATAEQLNEGLSQLRVPLSVSGLDRSRIERFKQELSGLQGSFISYPGAAAPIESPAQDPAAIVPGGNFAGALSYGDLTVAGVGTATVVCDGRALAFGHPLTFRGEAGLSAHSADAITIVTDPTLGSFKLANIGGVVGTLDQDRLTAIRAQLGEIPTSIPVNSTVNATDTGRTREGTTQVNEDEDLPFLAAFHLVSNLDRVLDRFGEGTAEVTWTATGETASGQSWTVTRANRFASQFDISFESIFELLSMLSAIQQNEFEEVHFTGVTIDAVAGGEYRAYRLGQV